MYFNIMSYAPINAPSNTEKTICYIFAIILSGAVYLAVHVFNQAASDDDDVLGDSRHLLDTNVYHTPECHLSVIQQHA